MARGFHSISVTKDDGGEEIIVEFSVLLYLEKPRATKTISVDLVLFAVLLNRFAASFDSNSFHIYSSADMDMETKSIQSTKRIPRILIHFWFCVRPSTTITHPSPSIYENQSIFN